MKLGDTFLGAIVGHEEHLHVVISNPTETDHAVVLTLVATYDGYQNDTCILRPSDGHPFIRHLSYVAYESAVLFPVAKLEAMKKKDEIKIKPSFSPEVMQRILEGADKFSSRIRHDCWLVLHDQNLVPH